MTEIVSLASSSSGNATLLRHNGLNILIDAGLSAKRICEGLSCFSIDADCLHAVFVTHEHRDHTAGLPVLLKNRDIPIYTSFGTHGSLGAMLRDDQQYCLYQAGETFSLCGDLQVTTFKTPHDTPESNGFLFDTGHKKIAYATDLGYLSEANAALLAGSDIVMMEANYDRDMLFEGSYPYMLKQRISGLRGHQDNRDCADALVPLIEQGATQVMLMHLSRENNHMQVAMQTACDILDAAGIVAGRDLRLSTAPYDTPCEVLVCSG